MTSLGTELLENRMIEKMKNILNLLLVISQVLCLFILPAQSKVSTDNPVGTIEGTAGVSLTGSATYQIPITIPSGDYSFAPSVSLVYNSHSGDQIAGYGWSLTCTSSIVRCGRTYHIDEEATEVNFSSADNLKLNGQRLLLASGKNLTEGAIYYPESDPKTKIVCHVENDAIGFYVYHGDGSVSEYGLSEYCSLGKNNKKWMWLLNKTTDLRGRSIAYTYTITTSDIAYLTKISYDTNKSVEFNYEPRPYPSQIYYAGQSINHTKRLSKISTFIQNKKLNEYRLSYDNNDLYSRLTDITLYGNDGITHFKPTHISYDGQSSTGEGFAEYSPKRVGFCAFYGDIDGDGRTDIVTHPRKEHFRPEDYLYVYLSKSGNSTLQFELADSIQLGTAFHGLTLRDMNGDGICDITLRWADKSQAKIVHYSCESGRLSYIGEIFMPWSDFDLGDYDGDGRTDFLCRVENRIYNLSGDIIATAKNVDWNYSITSERFIPTQKIICDVNGNGKEDFIVLKDNLKVYEVVGNIVKEVTTFCNPNINKNDIISIGDFNGDGYTDIIAQRKKSSEKYEAKLYLSSGQSFILVGSFTVSNSVRTADFNKDGKCDIFYWSKTNEKIIYNIGISRGNSFDFISTQSAYLRPSHFEKKEIEGLYTVADFDGDGMDEFGLFSFSDLALIKNFPNSQKLTVSEITDGLGKKVTYSYSPSSDSSVCTFAQSNYGYPLARPSGAMDLVSCMELSNDKENFKTKYNYQSPIIHIKGRGSLGFAKYRSFDETKQMVSITSNTFRRPYYYCPSSSEVQIKTYAGDTISIESKRIDCASNSRIHPKAFIPHVYSKIYHDYIRDLWTNQTTKIDGYGNPIEVQCLYDDRFSDKEVVIYENTTSSKWVIGQPISITKYLYNTSHHTKEKQELLYDSSSRLVKKVTSYKGLKDEKVSEEDYIYSKGNIASHSVKHYNSTTALSTSYEYTTDQTNLASLVDPYQLKTIYTYNSIGQKDCETAPDGHSVSYIYDSMGRLKCENSNDSTSVSTDLQWDSSVTGAVYRETTTVSDGAIQTVWYDAFGREVRNSCVRFDGTELKTDRVYNGKGQLWKVSMPYKIGSPTQWDIYTYNNNGTLSSIDYASGKKVEYSYDKRNTTITTDGIAVTKTVNARGELIKVSDPKGDIIYTLHPDGQPQTVEAIGVKTSFEYDSYGRRIAINDPSAGLRRFEYNENGQLSAETDADGRTVSYTYDNYGRVADICRAEMATHYEYDNKNQLASISSDNGTGELLSYDNYGRLSATTTRLPNNKYLKREYTYQKGNVSAIKYSNQSLALGTETFTYANGCLKNISFNSQAVWQIEEENDRGQCIAEMSGPVHRIYSYNDVGLLTGRKMQRNHDQLMNFSYSFNGSTGNLSWRKDVIRDKKEAFEYDDINRLASYSGNTITYDDKGNILSKSDAGLNLGYNHSTKPYAVTNISPGFSPSAVRYSQQYISYNSFECPDTISDNGPTCSFVYNTDGERVMMKSHSHKLPTRYYVGNIYEEEYLNDTTTYRLYLGGDAYSAPAVYVWKGNSGRLYYIGRDNLGSITHITDNTGNLLHEYSYDPWGRLRNPATQQVYNIDLEPHLFLGRGYCGHEHLEWCGIINMNARLYDPTIGRFLNSDPYVQAPDFSQNFNRYSYCLNNPLKYTDPSGEWALLDDGIAMLVGGVLNLGSNLLQGNVHSIGQGALLFVVGAVAGEAALYTGAAAPYVSAGITSVGNDLVNQGVVNGSINWAQIGTNFIMSEAMAGFSLGLSEAWNGPISNFVSTLHIKSPAVNEMLCGSLQSGATGAIVDGYLIGVNGGTSDEMFDAILRGGGIGLVSGSVSGFANGVKSSRKAKISPWTGEKMQQHHSFQKALGGDPNQELTPMSTSRHQNLHRDMNSYLKTQTTEIEGKIYDMYPRKGNKGVDVQHNFTYPQRLDAVKNFYDKHPIKYYDARWQFYKNNGIIYQWRPW